MSKLSLTEKAKAAGMMDIPILSSSYTKVSKAIGSTIPKITIDEWDFNHLKYTNTMNGFVYPANGHFNEI